MSEELYFIPIIAEALQQEDKQTALTEAFEKIKELGKKPQYKQGFGQFARFIDSVNSHTKKNKSNMLTDNMMRVLITDIATDTFEGTEKEKEQILDAIQSHPEWKNDYEQLLSHFMELESLPQNIKISVFREQELLEQIEFTDIPGFGIVGSIVPANYRLAFDSGQILWEGQLTERQLLWSEAHPGEPLKMAAATDRESQKPTEEVSVFGGEIVLQVFAGIESGSIKITMNTSKDSK